MCVPTCGFATLRCKSPCKCCMEVARSLCWGGYKNEKTSRFRVQWLELAMKGSSCVRPVRVGIVLAVFFAAVARWSPVGDRGMFAHQLCCRTCGCRPRRNRNGNMCLVVLMLCCRAGSNMRVCHFAAQIPLQWQCGRCRALVLGRMPGGETLLLKWLELPDMCVATCGFATWLVLGSVQDRETFRSFV
jgi:hypothetical protein